MMIGKERASSHLNEEKSFEILKQMLPIEWVFRKYTPDYGIDFSIELFEQNDGKYYTQGEHLYIQLKSIKKPRYNKVRIYPRINIEKEQLNPSTVDQSSFIEVDVLKYVIETTLLTTVEKMGSAVPVLLIAVDISSEEAYYICLNDYIEKIIIPSNPLYYEQKTITLNIPLRNKLDKLIGKNIFECYAKRGKLFSFFNKVAYQYHELQNSNGDIDMAKHFSNILARLDVWSASKYLPALSFVKDKFFHFHNHGQPLNLDQTLNSLEKLGHDINAFEWEDSNLLGTVSLSAAMNVMEIYEIWRVMDNVGRIFEDILKECDLPTYIGHDLAIR